MYLTRVTASLLACTALAATAVAQTQSQGKPFKDALPAGTLAFFSVPDLDTSLAEFQQTALAKMWREKEVQDFVADAMKLGQAKWEEGLATLKQMNEAGMFPVSPDDLLKLRVRSFDGALTSFQLAMGGQRPEPRLGVILHLDFGASAPTWRKLAEVGLGALQAKTQGMLERSEKKLDGDVTLITFVPPKTGMSLNIAFVGTRVVIGTIQEEVAACVNAITGQKTILTAVETYRATTRFIDSTGAEMEGYVHVEGIADVLMETLKFAEANVPRFPKQYIQAAGVERALTALGMRSIKAMGFAEKYDGAKAVGRAFVLAPAQSRRGVFSAKSTPLDFGFLKWVPKDVASLTASNLDLRSVYDGLIAAVKAYNPQQADQMLGMLKQQEEAVGISLEKDLFGVFGDQMVWWSMGVQNFMSAPEGALLLKVNDQERLLTTLKKIEQLSGGVVEFPASERKGMKTWRVELNPEMVNPQIAGALSFLQPCFAFKNGYMVMALATGDVRKAMTRMDREDDPKDDVRSNREFAGYLGKMQAQAEQSPVSGFSWTDWKVSFENMYQAVTSVLALAVSADEVPFDLTLLPEAETLSQHLYSSASWSSSNKDGYLTMGISPIGPEVAAGAVAIGAGAALFGVTQVTRRQAMRAEAVEAERAQDAARKRKDENKKIK